VLEAKAGWQDILRAHDLHCVLLPFPESGEPLPLVQALFSDPHWALVAFNDQAVALVERTEANRELIERREFKALRPGDWTFAWTESADTRVQGAAETERLLTACPDSRFARTAKVRLLMSSGRFSEAVEELRWILREYPEAGSGYWRDYGYALCRIGRIDTADKVFSRMISKNQLIGFACFMRYHVALERRDVTTARRFLAQALEIEPGNQDYRLARRNLDQALLTK
jgi:tetratricopeptide (TPR) repeat protein